MQSAYMYLIAGLFLPLFPFSMVFNALFARVRNVIVRSVLLLAWPQLGLALLYAIDASIPPWFMNWAVLTAFLYGLRALTLRELGLWASFLASSAWALLWIPAAEAVDLTQLQFYALGFSIPLLLLVMLGAGLVKRFGAAYAGLHGGLAQTLPRFSGVLVVVVLAVIATPLFPAFITMLATIIKSVPSTPLVATAVALVWLLWSWSGARLLQGFIVGPALEHEVDDLSLAVTWTYGICLVALALSSLYLIGNSL